MEELRWSASSGSMSFFGPVLMIIEPMANFTGEIKYFCNVRIAGLGEIFVLGKFLAARY